MPYGLITTRAGDTETINGACAARKKVLLDAPLGVMSAVQDTCGAHLNARNPGRFDSTKCVWNAPGKAPLGKEWRWTPRVRLAEREHAIGGR